ncbi:MAG: sigma-70 family RNA polymerase sigma factor, partial [Solirubrobacterales bacterium]
MEASREIHNHGFPPAGAGGGPSRLLTAQPDRVLCRLAARGHDTAFEALYDRYKAPVHAFVFHLNGRPGTTEDAEDVVQETFGKAFTSLRDKRFQGSFKAWLFTIARNATFDRMRSRKPEPVAIDDDETVELRAVSAGPEDEVEQRDQLQWLVGAMAALPDRQREALVLRELGGMSHKEISSALDTTVPGVKKLISRGRTSVGDAAEASGVRSRDLARDLVAIAPMAPVVAGGFGLATIGGGAA